MATPTPEQALVAALSADATIAGLCTGGVYCDAAPQQATNYLLAQTVSDITPLLLSGQPIGIRKVRFQLTGYFDSRSTGDAFKARLTATGFLNGQVNATLGGLPVRASRVIEDEGAADEDESPRPGEQFGQRVVRVDLLWII